MSPKFCSWCMPKDRKLTAQYRFSVVSVSLQRRLSVSMKLQGTPGILRKNASASTGEERHKMLFYRCYGGRCPQCMQPDQGRDGACASDLSGHAAMWLWNATKCTRWFPHCTQGVHGLFGSLVGASEKVKKAPAYIVTWHDAHKQLKFRPVWRLPVVKGRLRDRITLMTITRGASVLRKEHVAAG